MSRLILPCDVVSLWRRKGDQCKQAECGKVCDGGEGGRLQLQNSCLESFMPELLHKRSWGACSSAAVPKSAQTGWWNELAIWKSKVIRAKVIGKQPWLPFWEKGGNHLHESKTYQKTKKLGKKQVSFCGTISVGGGEVSRWSLVPSCL